jgi:hypothetical protein
MTHPRATAALTCGAVAVLAVTAAAQPAMASTVSWKAVYSHHYGAAANQNGFEVALAPARNQAWALGGSDDFGGSPIAAHWTGGRWRNTALPGGLTSGIIAASASSPSNVWAVVDLGEAVLRWNGHRWSVAKSWPKTGEVELTGVTAISPTDVWVFGSGGFTGGLGTWHYNGRSWKHETRGAVSGITLASAVSGTDMWAIGSKQAPQDSIVRYYRGRWKFQTAPVLTGLQFNSILALSADNVWAVASQQTNSTKTFLLHYSGNSWSKVSVPGGAAKNGQLYRLTADGDGGFYLQTVKRLLHRTATNGWAGPLPANVHAFGLAPVPGRHLLLAAGTGPAATGSGADAVVYEAKLGG